MRERRSEVRILCADLVDISWKDAEGRTHRAEAVLEDIAASGACLHLETPVPLDVVLHWRSRKKAFSGWVRYCLYREIGYFVGVQFDSDSKWSKRIFTPRHLLDMEQLIARKKRRN